MLTSVSHPLHPLCGLCAYILIYCAGNEGQPIYTFTPASSGWTVIDDLCDTENIVVAYGGASSMTTLETDANAQLAGNLILNVSNAVYKTVKDNLTVTIHGCGVHKGAETGADATESSPSEAYAEYLSLGKSKP